MTDITEEKKVAPLTAAKPFVSTPIPMEEQKKLFVTNLPVDITSKDLHSFFSGKGYSVIYANVNNKSGVFKTAQTGIATFCSNAEAQKAVANLNNQTLKGQEIKLEWFINSQNLVGRE